MKKYTQIYIAVKYTIVDMHAKTLISCFNKIHY